MSLNSPSSASPLAVLLVGGLLELNSGHCEFGLLHLP